MPQKLNLKEKRGLNQESSKKDLLLKINHFLALLAKEGILPDESEEDLSDDLEELLHADNPYKYVFSLYASLEGIEE